MQGSAAPLQAIGANIVIGSSLLTKDTIWAGIYMFIMSWMVWFVTRHLHAKTEHYRDVSFRFFTAGISHLMKRGKLKQTGWTLYEYITQSQ